MENIDNIMQLCRLCLVKEQVNTPIFGQNNDLEEISAKIRSCLPVKVSPDDSLPKKICDGCSYKLDLLYVFRNTSINSEKQLYQWLEQAGITKTTAATATTMSTPSITATTNPTTPAIPSTDPIIPTIPATNTTALDNIVNDAITKSEISVKQEKSDSTAGSELSAETQEYLLQQQKLPYQESFGDFNTETNSAEPEEPARKKLRRAAASKPPIKDNESDPDMPPTKAEDDSDEDMDDMGDGGMDDDDDDDEEEEEDGLDHPEFVDVPSTSAEEQPGPSGVNKDPIAAPIAKHIGENVVECSLCLKVVQICNWRRHAATHSTDHQYSCEICRKTFKYRQLLMYHQKVIHCKLNAAPKHHECDICHRRFLHFNILQQHRPIHFKTYATKNQQVSMINKVPKSPQMGDKTVYVFKVQCYICRQLFGSVEQLQQHKRNEHPTSRQNQCNNSGKNFHETNEVQEFKPKNNQTTPHYCEICQKSFLCNQRLQWHNNKVHGQNDEKYLCKICNVRYMNLEEHIENIHETVQQCVCEICGKVLKSSKTLLEHKKALHQGGKTKYQGICPICNMEFAYLKKHMSRTHNDNRKIFICDLCGKCLTTLHSLRDHKDSVHLRIKSLQCDVCEKKFSKRTTLEIHKRIHTGERPHVCKICGKSFSQRSPLTLHLRQHTGDKPYSCELCDEKFVSKSARDYHLKTKHNKL